MLYFDEKWKPMTKKITYTKEFTVYDTDEGPYLNNPKFQNVVIEDLSLTDEQMARLEKVKNVESVGLIAVEQYVLDGTLTEASPSMVEQLQKEDAREMMLKYVKVEEISAEELEQMKSMFKVYELDAFYTVGEVINHDGQLYKIIQAHTSQSDWVPNTTPALYTKVVPPGAIPQWIQPTGAHDAYALGEKVLFEGKTYESLISSNAYSPTAYPAGWKLTS